MHCIAADHVESTCFLSVSNICCIRLLEIPIIKKDIGAHTHTHDQCKNSVENNQLSKKPHSDINQSLVATTTQFSLSHSTHFYVCIGFLFLFFSHSFTKLNFYIWTKMNTIFFFCWWQHQHYVS